MSRFILERNVSGLPTVICDYSSTPAPIPIEQHRKVTRIPYVCMYVCMYVCVVHALYVCGCLE